MLFRSPTTSPSILSTKRQAHAMQYILQSSPEAFSAELISNGATIVESDPLSLTEIFLELCRTTESKEASREEAAA